MQPVAAGAPQPVQGVTGGPGLPQGVASVDGTTGNVVISPPNNTVQFRKTDSPQSLQVYEYFHSNTDFARIALEGQTGGPFQLAVEVEPPGVIRGLEINAGGSLFINTDNVHINTSVEITGNLVVDAPSVLQAFEIVAGFTLLTQPTPIPGPTIVALGNSTLSAVAGTHMLDWIVNVGGTAYRVQLFQ